MAAQAELGDVILEDCACTSDCRFNVFHRVFSNGVLFGGRAGDQFEINLGNHFGGQLDAITAHLEPTLKVICEVILEIILEYRACASDSTFDGFLLSFFERGFTAGVYSD